IWFVTVGAVLQAPGVRKYAAIAFASGAAGYGGAIIWGLTYAPIRADALMFVAPYLGVAAVVGTFWVHHLDNVRTDRRPSRLREISLQSIVLGSSGLIAATASFATIGLAAVPVGLDRILLTGLTSAAIGGLLGCYIPAAAAAARRDPLT